MSEKGRFRRAAALLACVVVAFAVLDWLTSPPAHPSPAPRDATEGQTGAGPSGSRRAFVFVIDSLRFQTATDPAFMPHLIALRSRATFAKVRPTRDAVTVPSLRAAFTGEDRTRLLGFVANFLTRRAGLDSVLSDVVHSGRRAVTYSDDALAQFGVEGLEEQSNGADGPTEVADQSAVTRRALAAFLAGKYALSVMHVTFTDHVAHEEGIHGEGYRERFRAADELVDELDRAIPAEDTLLVMGDHGHDEAGRHTFGIDVPTVAVYRGAAYAAGKELGTIPIRDHRYLLGWGLGLPLPAGYAAGRHPDALVSRGAVPLDYATPGAAPHLDAGSSAHGGWPLLVSGVVAVLALALLAGGTARARVAIPTALVVGVLFHGAGRLFPGVRPWLHEPEFASMAYAWGAVLAAVAVVSAVRGSILPGLWLLAVPLFVLPPTAYRYGAPAAMAPVWFGILVACAIAVWKRGEVRRSGVTAGAFLAVAAVFLAPFAAADASDFKFVEWALYPEDSPVTAWRALALVARTAALAHVALSAEGTLAGLGAGVLAAGMLGLGEAGVLPRNAELWLAIGALAGASVARFRSSRYSAGARQYASARVACVAGLLGLHHALTRAPEPSYYWFDCLLAALALSSRIVDGLPVAKSRRAVRAVLGLLSVLAAGWSAFGWTLHRMEWRFLYDFASAPAVERSVGSLLPVILGRYLLLAVAARLVLGVARSADEADPWPLAARLVVAKVACLVAFTTGLAVENASSDIYLESAQETAITAVLGLGLF